MKVTRITCFEVIVPAYKGAIESEGLNKALHKLPIGAQAGWTIQFDQISKLIIKLELDSGIIGWGELYRSHNWSVVEDIIKILLGQELDKLCLQKLPFSYSREYDGFECAIWDAYAKKSDLRLVDLLGGPLRDKVKIGAWSSHRRAEDVAELAQKMHTLGYNCIKFKADLEDDVIRWCEIIAEVAPGMDPELALDQPPPHCQLLPWCHVTRGHLPASSLPRPAPRPSR